MNTPIQHKSQDTGFRAYFLWHVQFRVLSCWLYAPQRSYCSWPQIYFPMFKQERFASSLYVGSHYEVCQPLDHIIICRVKSGQNDIQLRQTA